MLAIHRILSVSVAVIILARPDCVIAEEQNGHIDTASIIEKIDVAGDGIGHLLLPIVINNKRYNFMLDTCSTPVIYDVSFRSILGKQKRRGIASTHVGSVEIDYYDSPIAFLGKLCLKTEEDVAVMDLRRLREMGECDCYGVIGLNFLKQHIVRINFDKGEVYFLKSAGRKPGEPFRLTYQSASPCIEPIIESCKRREKFRVDTGADTNYSGHITYDYYTFLTNRNLTRVLAGSHTTYPFVGKPSKCTDFLVESLSLGRFFRHNNLIFSTSEKHRCNILGLGFLCRFILTIDFPHNLIYLKKGKMFDLPDVKDLSGLSIARRAGKTVVTNVAWFSPASWTDISPGDVILSIGGNNANQISLYSLRRLLGIRGKKVGLVLQRGQEHFAESLTLGRDE